MRSLANVFEVGFVPSICVAALSLRVIILDHLDTSKNSKFDQDLTKNASWRICCRRTSILLTIESEPSKLFFVGTFFSGAGSSDNLSQIDCKQYTFHRIQIKYFSSDPGVPGIQSMGPDVRPSVHHNFQTQLMWLWLMRIATQYQLMMSIGQFGNASGATWWPKLKLKQVATLSGQTCNKKPQLLAKSTTNACSVIWWPKLELIQVTTPVAKIGTYASENWKKKKSKKKIQKSGEKIQKSWKKWKNIARGTTDPGYWVRNLNHLFFS